MSVVPRISHKTLNVLSNTYPSLINFNHFSNKTITLLRKYLKFKYSNLLIHETAKSNYLYRWIRVGSRSPMWPRSDYCQIVDKPRTQERPLCVRRHLHGSSHLCTFSKRKTLISQLRSQTSNFRYLDTSVIVLRPLG